MCNYVNGECTCLYVWKVEYLTESEKRMINEGIYSSRLDGSHKDEDILNYVYNKVLDLSKETGDLVKSFLKCDYHVVTGGYN